MHYTDKCQCLNEIILHLLLFCCRVIDALMYCVECDVVEKLIIGRIC